MENFVVVLPLSQIRMASFFEQAAYTKFEIVKGGASAAPAEIGPSVDVVPRAAASAGAD
jgi:hypothetical protein